jgi:hypothetical protein
MSKQASTQSRRGHYLKASARVLQQTSRSPFAGRALSGVAVAAELSVACAVESCFQQ